MICNKCGTDVPDHSNFCVRCGNRLRPETAVPNMPAPQQPQQSPQPAAKPQSSSTPFGGRQISDKHYSLEDIARQQAESNNEIGLASAPPDRGRKPKKRRRPPEAALPPIGSSDDMDMNALKDSPSQPTPPAPSRNDVQSANPLLQPLNEVRQAARQGTKPTRHMSKIPEKVNPLLKPIDELVNPTKPRTAPPASSQTTQPQNVPSVPLQTAQPQNVPSVPLQTAQPQNAPSESVQPARPASSYTGQTYRYTITTPPVPYGLQQQTNIPLFSGDITAQVETLRREYFAKKNASTAH